MNREPAPNRRPPTGVAPVAGRVPHALDGMAFLVLLLIVSMRALLSETYESGLTGVSQAVGDIASLTPATTVMLDTAIWVAAAMAALATLLRSRSWQRTGIEAGWAIMAVAAVCSCCVASNKRLAINASCDWLTTPVLAITLANLLRERRRVVLVLAVVVASGLASATKCGSQLGWEFGDTWQAYQEQKAEFWGRQGVALTDPTVELFERRMMAREATGFLPYSNAQGAGLILAGFAGIALAFLSGRSRTAKGVCGVVAAVILASVVTTGSRGAMLAALIGLALLIAGTLIGSRWYQKWKALWAGLWITAAIGVALVVIWGTTRGRLPGDSLRFRWEYWRVTSKIVAEHPWTGVGALNFDRAYLKHKPVQYPEEIRDPHNFAMAIVSQWGIIGGAGMMIALLGGSWVAIRALGQESASPPEAAQPKEPVVQPLGKWVVAVIVGFVLFRLWMLRGWLDVGEGGVATVLFDLLLYGLVWCLAFAGLSLLLSFGWDDADMGSASTAPQANKRHWPSQKAHQQLSPPYQGGGRGGDGYRLPCLIALGVFLLHNTIDFSLFVPGTLTTFAALTAVAVARAAGQGEGSGAARRWLPMVASAGGLLAVIILLVAPVLRCTSSLKDARFAVATGLRDPAPLYKAAAEADRFDPTPLTEWASWAAHLDVTGLDKSLTCLQMAQDRDPLDRGIYRSQWRVLELRYDAAHNPADLLQAVAAAEKAVDLYPQSPDGHADLARLLGRVASEIASDPAAEAVGRDWLADAVMHYRRALHLDAARPSYEIRRWHHDRRMQIEGRLSQLERMASARAGS
ncbi:MAG TPA: O-antigen ligase family protein [Phycisphaerae bacterium]|nr:O-antigen ligase family protein [Phycisphaerae bacterium]HRR85279.1 O-antigen ligase family protein [Phycisphaerae bacterium]